MTIRSITFNQQKQFKRFVEDAGNRALKEVNLDRDGLQYLIEHGGDFQAYLIDGVRRFGAKVPSYGLARSILGVDFITPERVAKARKNIVYTDEQISKLIKNLPSEAVLKWCKDHGYAVIPAPPTTMSILDIREVQRDLFCSKTGGWYDGQRFACKDKTSFGWLSVKKTPVQNSIGKMYDEQEKLLFSPEKVPNAAEMCWFITTYFKVCGIQLFKGVYVRTSSWASVGYHVCVGFSSTGEIDIRDSWDGYDNTGLSVALVN
ncbi:MAG: hypothetical protein WCX70_00480 [Candidatus Paceibacterota bacterium]|jgi:hypothetical protein